MIGTVEVKKKIWIGKIEAKKEKFGQMHFRPFIPVQFSYLRCTLSPSQHSTENPSVLLTFDRPYLI